MRRAEMRPFQGSGADWDSLIAGLPGAHLLQTWEWAQVKAAYGWQPAPYVWRRSLDGGMPAPGQQGGADAVVAAAMVLTRPVLKRGFVRRLCILYVPKGPLLDPADAELGTQVLGDLEALGRRASAILVKIDPDIELGRGYSGTVAYSEDAEGAQWARLMRARGWRFSDAQIQFRNSVWIDLSDPADELLARMKPKARYNIGLAARRGVSVRTASADDLPLLFRMYAETAQRDGFVIRSEAYYRTVWSGFMGLRGDAIEPAAEALVAEVAGEPVAALWLFRFARRAYYLYGMSRAAHREKMPNHLLQWEAIQRAQQRGCSVYDLWGAPDTFDESDSMWGVFRFKEGLGGYVVRTLGAWDYPSGGLWYPIYGQVVPRALAIMRWRGRNRKDAAAGDF